MRSQKTSISISVPSDRAESPNDGRLSATIQRQDFLSVRESSRVRRPMDAQTMASMKLTACWRNVLAVLIRCASKENTTKQNACREDHYEPHDDHREMNARTNV